MSRPLSDALFVYERVRHILQCKRCRGIERRRKSVDSKNRPLIESEVDDDETFTGQFRDGPHEKRRARDASRERQKRAQ